MAPRSSLCSWPGCSQAGGLAAEDRPPGLVHGLTEWGLITAVAIFLPSLFGIIAGVVAPGAYAFWAVFWSLLIGLGAALVGGVVGGSLPAPGGSGQGTVRDLGYGEDRAA